MGEVKIEIDEMTGKVKIEGIGYEGLQCAEDLDSVIRLIGASVESSELKEKVTHKNTMHIRR